MSAARRRELLLILANALSELAMLEADAAPEEVYSSRSLPPDVASRTMFARACRTIADARRQGKTWIVPRAAWERARLPRRAERSRNRNELRAVLGLARRAA